MNRFGIFQKRPPRHMRERVILDILDASAKAYVFPMLDNGYIYLAASRLSLFRSDTNWAVVFEIFGFSPRVGRPDLAVITIGSDIYARQTPEAFGLEQAYADYLAKNPYWEYRSCYPITNEDWIDLEEPEMVVANSEILLRGQPVPVPSAENYPERGVNLQDDRPAVFELCRYLAHDHRDAVLATQAERRGNTRPEMQQILLLEEWHHPDCATGQLPSETRTFRQIARVLERNAPDLYSSPDTANSHWVNWPDGGSL